MLFVIKSQRLRSFRTDLPPGSLAMFPWAVPMDATIGRARERLASNALDTLLVFDADGVLGGVLTESVDTALFGKKTKRNREALDACWAACVAACADRGGCLWAIVDYDDHGNVICAGHNCNNDVDEGQELSTLFE
jgi:hypothetical protein